MGRVDEGMAWLAKLYCNTMNVIHYMHDKYAYERREMALLDYDPERTLACGIAGLSGALLAPINTLSPQFGLRFLINSFLVVILGKPGSIKGMLIAACVLGGSLGILQFHVSTVYAQMIDLLVAIIATRLRPLLQKI